MRACNNTCKLYSKRRINENKMKNIKNNKNGQEEMVGFALIIIIVAVILLVFLVLSLRNQKEVKIESYEVSGFLSSMLQYTSDCENNNGYITMKEMIIACSNGETCLNEKNSCEVLNKTISDMTFAAWGPKNNVKGWNLTINSNEKELIGMSYGNKTKNYREPVEILGSDENVEIMFRVYY